MRRTARLNAARWRSSAARSSNGTGGAVVRNSVVLIRGDRVERVGTTGSLTVPPGYDLVSTEGMTALPGLWDLHVHLMYAGHPNAAIWQPRRARSSPSRSALRAFADVIAVRGDPLTHIDVFREPKVVIKHGRRYK